MKAPVKTLNQAILAAMETYAERTCFKIKQGKHYQSISYRQFEELTFRMVRFLQSLGISRGEHVAIAADNSVQWMVVYVATLLAGGVAAPLRASLAPDTLRFMLEDLGASLVLLDDEHLIQTVSPSLLTENETHLPELKAVLVTNEAGETLPGTISLADVLAETDPLTPEARDAIRTHAESIGAEALATIHYTAGKTGQPKGAVFDQARLWRTMQHGEVLIRSESVMREYWQRPADTQQALDADGWLHTGDLGYLDQDGYLYLTGLKQPLLILSTGRKIMPTIIENALMASPFIAQAVVF